MILALNSLIDVAEQDFENADQKKAWYQTVLKLRDKRIANVGVGPLCKLFDKSRQAYYQKHYHTEEVNTQNILVPDLVAAAFRREIPGVGTNKLYRLIRPSLHLSEIKMGRDKPHSLLQAHNLIIRASRRIPKTTNSNHWMKKYPNLIKDLQIVATEQVWVCDLTYICVGMTLITYH